MSDWKFSVGDRVSLQREHVNAVECFVTSVDREHDIYNVRSDGWGYLTDASRLTHIPPDWSKPIEAYHPDGRVVDVSLSDSSKPHRGDWDYFVNEELDGLRRSFASDGSHPHGAKWRIRNRVPVPEERIGDQTRTIPWGDPEINAWRDLISDIASSGYEPYASRAAALLPVDPLVQRAREICADAVKPDYVHARRFLRGERDDVSMFQAVLAALREAGDA